MFSHQQRIKSTVFQCFCEYVRAHAFVGDHGRDPEFHLSPSLKWECRCGRSRKQQILAWMIPRVCFLLMSSSQCCIALHVQGLFHIARCKSGIVPAPHAEALEDCSELMTDSASRVVDLYLRLVGYLAAVAEHRHLRRAAPRLRCASRSHR